MKRFMNVLTSVDVENGEAIYTRRIEEIGSVWASLVAAGDRVYVFDRDGKTAVFRHGDEFELLAVNELDGHVDASPAIVGDALYVRTDRHLYCLARSGE